MTETEIAELKADFLDWSGGFPPESEYQITVYCDYCLAESISPTIVRRLLIEWYGRAD